MGPISLLCERRQGLWHILPLAVQTVHFGQTHMEQQTDGKTKLVLWRFTTYTSVKRLPLAMLHIRQNFCSLSPPPAPLNFYLKKTTTHFFKVSLDSHYDPQRCLDRVSSSFISFHRRICKSVPIRVSDVTAVWKYRKRTNGSLTL